MDYPEREGGNAKRNLSKMYVDEFNLNIVVPLTIVDLCRDSAKLMRAWLCAHCSRLTLSTSVATRQRLKASFHLCSRCSIGCNRGFRSWSRRLSVYRMRLKGLTAALIGLSVLCWTGCASSRRATSSHSEQVSSLTNVESATPWHSSSELGSAHGLNADFKIQVSI